VRASGTIVLGHRESSILFSYLSPRGEPIGYAVDLCTLVVEAIGEEVGRTLAIRWQPVTAESRIAAVASGQIDGMRLDHQQPRAAEAGELLADLLRLGDQAAGEEGLADPLVPRPRRQEGGGDRGHDEREDDARAGGEVQDRPRPERRGDHAASFALLTAGAVDAFASDDVLLYGLVAQNRVQGEYLVVGEFLSYDPTA
jgi:glutamate/aspartate transport system substrate-binding protein